MDERQELIEAQRKYGFARMTHDMSRGEPLLRFGRAFADPMRIRILALLSTRSMYGQELAEALNVATPTVSHHISILKAAGLVQVERENNFHHYHLDEQGLQNMTHLLTVEHLRNLAASFPAQETISPTEDEDRKMVREAFFKGSRLTSIPPGAKARRYALEKIAEEFEWGRIYDEKEVNAILKNIHPEAATLRRDLIDQKFMMRENGRYWLIRPQSLQEENTK